MATKSNEKCLNLSYEKKVLTGVINIRQIAKFELAKCLPLLCEND